MKKIAILLASVVLTGVSYAASFDWKSYTGQYVYNAGTTDKLSGATAYLFDSSVVTKEALLEGVFGTEAKQLSGFTSLAMATTTTSGSLSGSFEGGTVGETLTGYFAIFQDNNLFISTDASSIAPETGSATLTFKGLSNLSKGAATQYTPGTTISGGWYTAVPEPTSGLLMLLGMAGLALRRRRA